MCIYNVRVMRLNNYKIFVTLLAFIFLCGCVGNARYVDATALNASVASPAKREQVKVFESYDYYSVDVYEKKDLIPALINASPIRRNGKGYLGETHTYYKWTIDWLSDSSSCWVNKAVVELYVNLTLPKLNASNSDVKAVWEDWYPKLLRHEHNHRDIAIHTANKMLFSLSELAPASNCEDLVKNAGAVVSKYEAEEEVLHDNYDRETNHGETEGLIFHI